MKVVQYQTLLKENGENYLHNIREFQTENNLTNPESVFRFMENSFRMSELAEEYLYIIACNNNNKPIGVFEIAHGTVNSCVINPREIFIRLLLCGAVTFFLIHNHPSGDASPSQDDIRFTKNLLDVAHLIKINLLDHIIVGKDTFFSMRENCQNLLF